MLGNIHLSLRSFSPVFPVLHVHSKGLWGTSGPKVPGGCIIQRKAHPRTNTSDAFFPNYPLNYRSRPTDPSLLLEKLSLTSVSL